MRKLSMPALDPAEFVSIDGETYIAIRNVDELPPFLMSLVSDSDHWLFLGSNGPFSAGRVDSDGAVFPYQTADKIMRHPDTSGALTVIQVRRDGGWVTWQPTARNLFKHVLGTGVVFEEADDQLRFRWSLTTCEPYGFVRECRLENLSGGPLEVRVLDGWHQIIAPNISRQMYGDLSYLAAAYMRHEALADSLSLFHLNTRITDQAEPAESLRVAVAWTLGRENAVRLLCDRQVRAFRLGREVQPEAEIRGEMGAHLLVTTSILEREARWVNVIDTGLDQTAVLRLQAELRDPASLRASLDRAIEANRRGLRSRIAAADGLQDTADQTASAHHFANVLFNCMRGGAFSNGGRFPSSDFVDFVQVRNRKVYETHRSWLASLPGELDLTELKRSVSTVQDVQLQRIAGEYLPLTFSRRHGDPSRPWNHFNIILKDAQGRPIYSYQGNWRDIFQNWESLAQSWPAALEPMVSIFLNASTADGYNPYRISRSGIDWEVSEPDNPWGHIGYWGDHQIVYLLRLLESLNRFEPGSLNKSLNRRAYASARVPYIIADFEAICRDPKHTITFDHPLHDALMKRADSLGSDGKLVADESGEVRLVTLAEKLLVPALVKLSNLVPGGGIWLNTQRPEWNDANNALAGWGLSMVTVFYLRRYLAFLAGIMADAEVEVSEPVADLLGELTSVLSGLTADSCTDSERFLAMSRLGRAGARHRERIYSEGPSGSRSVRPGELIAAALPVLDAAIRESRRPDGLYESYNVLHLSTDSASIQRLALMLEGQVAALSSGALSQEEVVTLLQSLRASDLYRPDQHSYLLYPNRELTPILERNTFAGPPPVEDSALFVQDLSGNWHFQADLKNARDVASRLDATGIEGPARQAVLDLWEATFRHREFTGRSSTMFMFEGLGSIYWHMVAKLLLAVQERWLEFGDARIAAAYHDIRDGLGFRKTPGEYGAFPTDPYSHTPGHRGAQQPGMTGQVKEEILTRMGELGIGLEGGCLRFNPTLLSRDEFHAEPRAFAYVDSSGADKVWELPAGSLGFTVCQVPVCYRLADSPAVLVERADGSTADTLSEEDTRAVFERTGTVRRITVDVTLSLPLTS
ncbi:MAG: hypothetical protein MH204_02000 [Fimbriimonadaceae bacterium]|nr:hypothetical protein [Fimbriimonadaceae bacterium]